jgi:hypothetical protein
VRDPEDGVSVLRLAIDTTDLVQRRLLEGMFSATFSVRRAVQRDARDRTRAYRAAWRERRKDPAAVRARVGLSREALERAAYAHVHAAPHLRRFVTKALAMHMADSVWTATERHLFPDATGKRSGMPHPGAWYDFARIPGRARSHRKKHKWESFRLHGSLAGHRAAYTAADGRFFQPDHLKPIAAQRNWWGYAGPLAIVCTGLPAGTLAVPVRLPAAPSNQPILDHHLADPSRWHKIDLVRHRDPTAAGGWRYEAHLLVLTTPYVSPATGARREMAVHTTAERRAGVDVNVSNVSVASHADGKDLKITRIAREPREVTALAKRACAQRKTLRSLDRSRRARNPDQYELSARQVAHNQRRATAGLPPVQMIPRGPRRRRADGKPLQAYRSDQLSQTYRDTRGHTAVEGEALTRARRDVARQIAARLVAEHGCRLVVEDTDLRTWSRLWGRGIAAFTPGTLVTALDREATLVARIAGASRGLERASTRTTALSQHCLCGVRIAKSLSERIHRCQSCGLRGDRDAVAATLAACVVIGEPRNPASAVVDFDLARRLLEAPHTHQRVFDTLPYRLHGRQDVRSESTVCSARDGWFVAERRPTPDPVAVARRIVGVASYPTPDELGAFVHQTTSERVPTRASLHRSYLVYLRDSS